MPRVPVSADTYTGMKRLSSFGFVPQSGQGSVEKRAKPSEMFQRDQQQPPELSPSEPQQMLQPFRGLPSFPAVFSRITSFGFGYTDGKVVAMVRGPVRQPLWLHPLRVCELGARRMLLALRGRGAQKKIRTRIQQLLHSRSGSSQIGQSRNPPIANLATRLYPVKGEWHYGEDLCLQGRK